MMKRFIYGFSIALLMLFFAMFFMFFFVDTKIAVCEKICLIIVTGILFLACVICGAVLVYKQNTGFWKEKFELLKDSKDEIMKIYPSPRLELNEKESSVIKKEINDIFKTFCNALIEI